MQNYGKVVIFANESTNMRIMKKSFITLLLLSATLVACTNSKKEQDESSLAAGLLTEAREQLAFQNFDKAQQLLDSMRTTYPKAFDVRRSALNFADSIIMLEADYQLGYYDSLRAFAKLELQGCVESGCLPTDTAYIHLERRIDTLNMECNRLYQKVRFYRRKLEERSKQ